MKIPQSIPTPHPQPQPFQIRYNTDENIVEFYTGSGWTDMVNYFFWLHNLMILE